MATSLPLELQQHVFQYLEPRSFHSCRSVCRWWRHAATDSVTLASQLRQLPVQPPVSAKALDSERLRSLYDNAARILMLGMSVTTHESTSQSLSARTEQAKVAISRDGRRAVTLKDRTLTLHDLTSPQSTVISRRPLNDLRTAIGGGPWFKCAPTSVYELALSSTGNLLAIALDRTIQIYDMDAAEDSWPVSSYISSAAGHYIAGLQFQHNDSLLRVQLSNKGAVVYLGTPEDNIVGLHHWQGKGGIKHAFLDSSTASLRPLSHTGVPETLAGLQLLRPFQNGWLFAAQKRCPASPLINYCIGHVATSDLDGHVATAEKLAIIVADLAGSMDTTPLFDVYDTRQRLPSGLVQHPHFSLSSDSSLLAVSQSITAHAGKSNRVFVYRLPSIERMILRLECIRAAEFAATKQGSTWQHEETHTIQHSPLSIGATSGKALAFEFDSSDARSPEHLTAVTELGTTLWSLYH